MSKPKIPEKRADALARFDDCKARITALVKRAGEAGITSAEIRHELNVRFPEEGIITRATRKLIAEGAILKGEMSGSGSYRFRPPVRDVVAALVEVGTATRKAAA